MHRAKLSIIHLRHATITLMMCCLCLLVACSTSSPKQRDLLADERPLTPAEINVSLGQEYLSKGKLEMAKDKLLKAIQLDPKLPTAHTVIAVLYERIQDMDSAQRHYKKAVSLSPKNGAVLNNYGAFLCHQGKYNEADTYFTKALLDPFYDTPAVAYANRGRCALRADNFELAEESLRKAIKLWPEHPDALLDMAEILYTKEDYLKARAFMQRYESLVVTPTAESLYLAMQIETAMGNRPLADDYRQRLLTDFPDSSITEQLQ